MAFVAHGFGVLPRAAGSGSRTLSQRTHTVTPRPSVCKRPSLRMSAETPDAELKDASPAASSSTADNGTGMNFETPKLDTTAFSDFVDNAQAKVDELVAKAQDLDGAAVVNDVKVASVGLVDNAIAGDWLNRGELYGAIQLLFVFLLLRQPGFLDGLVGFLVGPATLLAGAALSGKALWDLGRKQVSIWPAPVPGAELRTDGLYAQLRHPVYAGLLLASLGFAVSTGSPERFAVTLAFGAFLSKKIEVEEEFLATAYEGWDEYTQDVPYKLLPKVW